jgi:hypothetical protein
MTPFVPVFSPVVSYEATGALPWNASRIASNCRCLHGLLRRVVAFITSTVLHDFSPSPASPRSRRAVRVLLLPLLATASACGDADTGYLALQLPASIAISFVLGVGCVLAGIAIGICVALSYLRAADAAVAQYHRGEIARVLGASSTMHASVQEVLSIVHRRTQELQRLVAMLQKGGAR